MSGVMKGEGVGAGEKTVWVTRGDRVPWEGEA